MDLFGQDELLQRFVDDELDPRTRREVEARLAQDPAATERVQALHRLRELMVLAREEQAARLDSEALFSRISAGLEADPEPVAADPRVSRTFDWLRGWLKGGAAFSAGAVAVAAAVLLTVILPMDRAGLPPRSSGPAGPATGRERGSGAARSDHAARARAAAGSEVVRVDFGNNTGTVFEIALAGGASTPVVWINDGE